MITFLRNSSELFSLLMHVIQVVIQHKYCRRQNCLNGRMTSTSPKSSLGILAQIVLMYQRVALLCDGTISNAVDVSANTQKLLYFSRNTCWSFIRASLQAYNHPKHVYYVLQTIIFYICFTSYMHNYMDNIMNK